MLTRIIHLRLVVVAVLAVALFALLTTAAVAAPAEPTLTVAQLQGLLDAAPGGAVDGHLKTVLKGKDIVDIDVRVQAITYGSQTGPDSLSALIVFQAYGPAIDELGGIASGMSGSPIYVDDNGTDRLVGALSYGNWFTLNGVGLATPIHSMSALEDTYGASITSVQELPKTMLTSDGLKNRVIITTTPEDYAVDAANGAIVAEPMSTVVMGGVRSSTKIFKEYAARLKSRGVELVGPQSGGMSSMTSTYSAPFEGGSAVAALATRGDLWAGGMGTATYENDGNVVSFGHPLYWSGATELFMANAWVDYTWPSLETPYKLMRPATLRGTVTQDRAAGIMGVDGPTPAQVNITAKAVNAATGQTAETTVTMPAGIINEWDDDFAGLPTMGAYVAGSRVFDQYWTSGSAVTKTTVVVSDGTTSYEINRNNVFDSGEDITYSAVGDVDDIVSTLQFTGSNGIATPHIQSIDLETTFSPNRKLAEVTGVNVVGGLRTGSNKVTVSYLEFGKAATRTVDVMLNIPTGVPLSGRLSASSAGGYWDDEDEEEAGDEGAVVLFDYEDLSGEYVDRTTVKEAVGELESAESNDTLVVTFQPVVALTEDDMESGTVAIKTYEPISANKLLGSYVVGMAMKDAAVIDATFEPGPTVPYYGSTYIVGELLGSEYGTGLVKVTRQYAGEGTVSTVANAKVADSEFYAALNGLKKNATIKLEYSGDANTLAATKTLYVKTAAKVALTRSAYRVKKGKYVTLTATLKPADTNGSVVFERYTGGRWKKIATKTISGGKAAYKYKAPLGTNKFRARTINSTRNAAGKSSTVTVKVVR